MVENSIWLATVGTIVLLTFYGAASYAVTPWV